MLRVGLLLPGYRATRTNVLTPLSVTLMPKPGTAASIMSELLCLVSWGPRFSALSVSQQHFWDLVSPGNTRATFVSRWYVAP